MKRLLLRSLAVLMVSCMFIITGSGFVMNDDEGYTEIVINGVDCLEKELLIIATLSGDDLISPMSFLCFFGHSTAHGTAIGTEHRYWVDSPRCRRTTYSVTYCTRSSCNYVVYTQTTQAAMHCCA